MILKANNLAKLIKGKRIELNLSQSQVHTLLGWKKENTQYLSNIECGKCQIPAKHINKLSSALHISRETIIDQMVKDYTDSLYKEIWKN